MSAPDTSKTENGVEHGLTAGALVITRDGAKAGKVMDLKFMGYTGAGRAPILVMLLTVKYRTPGGHWRAGYGPEAHVVEENTLRTSPFNPTCWCLVDDLSPEARTQLLGADERHPLKDYSVV